MEIKECKATEDDTSNDLMDWETRRQYGMLDVRKMQVWTNDAKNLSDINKKIVMRAQETKNYLEHKKTSLIDL